MGVKVSFENDTNLEYEVSIRTHLTGITVDKKLLKPGETWTKTDHGLSASMVYDAVLENSEVHTTRKYTIQAPDLGEKEKLYKISEILKGGGETIQNPITTMVKNSIGGTKEENDDSAKPQGTEGKSEEKKGNDETDEKVEADKEEVKEVNWELTSLEKRMLKSKKPRTTREKLAFRSALKKKYHMDSRAKHKPKNAKNQMAENAELAARNEEMLDRMDAATKEMNTEAEEAFKTFEDLVKQAEKDARGWNLGF